MLKLTELFTETALVLIKSKAKADASLQSAELANILENEIFKYQNGHKDAMTLVTRIDLCRMHSVKNDIYECFDKHHDLFSAVLAQLHDNIIEDYPHIDTDFIKNIENGIVNENDEYSVKSHLVKTYVVMFTCEKALHAFYDEDQRQGIPF